MARMEKVDFAAALSMFEGLAAPSLRFAEKRGPSLERSMRP